MSDIESTRQEIGRRVHAYEALARLDADDKGGTPESRLALLYARIVEGFHALFPIESASLFRYSDREPALHLEATQVRGQKVSTESLILPMEEGAKGITAFFAGQFLGSVRGKPQRVDYLPLNGKDLQTHKHNAGKPAPYVRGSVYSAMAVAIWGREDRFLGLAKLHNKDGSGGERKDFTHQDGREAARFAEVCGHFWEEELRGIDPNTLLRELCKLFDPEDLRTPLPDQKFWHAVLALGAKLVRADRGDLLLAEDDESAPKIIANYGPSRPDGGAVLQILKALPIPGDLEYGLLNDLQSILDVGNRSPHGRTISDLVVRIGDSSKPLGFLNFEARGRKPFQKRHIDRALLLARLIHSARRIMAQHRRTEFQLAAAESRLSASHPKIRAGQAAVVSTFLHAAQAAFPFDGALFYLPDHTNEVLRCVHSAGVSESAPIKPKDIHEFTFQFSARPSLAAHVWREGRAHFVHDLQQSEIADADAARRFGIDGKAVAVPVVLEGTAGRPLGVLVCWGQRLTLEMIEPLVRLGNVAAMALSKTVWHSQIESAIREVALSLEEDRPGNRMSAEIRSRVVEAVRACGFDRVRFFIYDKYRDLFIARESSGMEKPIDGMIIDPRTNPYARDTIASADRRVKLYDPARSKWGVDRDYAKLQKEPSTPWVVIPLISQEGELLGQIAADLQLANERQEAVSARLTELEDYLKIVGGLGTAVLVGARKRLRADEDERFMMKALESLRAIAHNLTGLVELRDNGVMLERLARQQWAELLRLETERLRNFVAKTAEARDIRRAPKNTTSTTFDLVVLLHRRLSAFKAEAEKSRVRVSAILMLTDCSIKGDAEVVDRAISLVLENALKYSEKGQLIQVSLGVSERNYLIVVSDEGPGVPETERERIFEPFVSIPRGRQSPDVQLKESELERSGLGLTLCRLMLETIGGRIHCRQRVASSGAEFVIELPRVEN